MYVQGVSQKIVSLVQSNESRLVCGQVRKENFDIFSRRYLIFRQIIEIATFCEQKKNLGHF